MEVAKYLVFEPNTYFTRNKLIGVLTPLLEFVKTSNPAGIFDYVIICDERNNKPAVIDRNDLVVDILLQPTRASEFILVNFGITRTNASFNESLV
jgi:hypothetical protein